MIKQLRNKRFNVDMWGYIKLDEINKTKVKIKNISKGGALLESPMPFKQAEKIIFEITSTHNDQILNLNAEVMWCRENSKALTGCQLGIQFITYDPDILRELYAFMSHLNRS